MILRIIIRRRRLLVNVTVLVAVIMILVILIFGLDVQDRYRPAWEAPQDQAGDRFYCARRSLELGAASPWIGWGTGSFAYHVPEAEARYPHNIFLELYAENGVLGLALLTLLLAGIAWVWLDALRLCPEILLQRGSRSIFLPRCWYSAFLWLRLAAIPLTAAGYGSRAS